MKRVLESHSQVAHVWAQQTQSEGKASRVFFEGNTIYSYGRHFPMGVILTNNAGDKLAALNSASYSVSTSKHQGYVRNAVNHLACVYVPTNVMALLSHNLRQGEKDDMKALVNILGEWLEKEVIKAAESASKRRMAHKKEGDINVALAHYRSARELLDFYGLKLPAKYEKLATALQDDYKTLHDKHARHLEAEKRKREKAAKIAQAEREKEANAAKPLWLAGDDTYKVQSLMRSIPPVLRVASNGEDIETSHGALFPVDHAKKAFMFIRNLREKGVQWQRQEHTGQAMTLGHFRIDKIDNEGNVTAGCHFVVWDAIEHVARVLKIYP